MKRYNVSKGFGKVKGEKYITLILHNIKKEKEQKPNICTVSGSDVNWWIQPVETI